MALVTVVANSSPYEGADKPHLKEHVIPVIFAFIAGITKMDFSISVIVHVTSEVYHHLPTVYSARFLCGDSSSHGNS
jgi:hypothetical protein